MDVNEFRTAGHDVIERIARYYEDELETVHVQSKVEPAFLRALLPAQAPEDPEPFKAIQDDFETKIMPGVTHWQSPNFHAYFPSNASFPSMLADMYSGMLNAQGFAWATCPSSTELETIVVDWMCHLLGLPESFLSPAQNPASRGGGSVQGTATEAIIVAMLAARDRAVRTAVAAGEDEALVRGRLVALTSDQAHAATLKGANILGVKIQTVKTCSDLRLTGSNLAEVIKECKARGDQPFYVTATLGTTSSGAFDDIEGICLEAAKDNMWVHVDGAWAGSAMVCEEYRYLMKGMERVDSFCANMHKWLLVNFDCSLLWAKSAIDIVTPLATTAAYLRSAQSDLVSDLRDWQVPFGRRFRALKIWFVLRSYGAKGLREHIRKHVRFCEQFHVSLMAEPTLFRIATPPSLALLTFQVIPPPNAVASASDLTRLALDRINSSGALMLTGTVLHGEYVIRFVPGSPLTEDRHIAKATEIVMKIVKEVVDGAATK